jgi:hypothetical protein
MPVGVRYSNDSFSLGPCRELDAVPIGWQVDWIRKLGCHVQLEASTDDFSISFEKRCFKTQLDGAKS